MHMLTHPKHNFIMSALFNFFASNCVFVLSWTDLNSKYTIIFNGESKHIRMYIYFLSPSIKQNLKTL